VVATGAPAAVLADAHVIESYLGAPEEREHQPVVAVASNGGKRS
jgi:hypothetical protein